MRTGSLSAQRRLDPGDEVGAGEEDVVAGGGPVGGLLLDLAQDVAGLAVGLLGIAQAHAGPLELAAQRGLVQLGGLQLGELAAGVVDHLARGLALLVDERQLAPGGLDLGPAGVEGPAGLLGRVGELAGPLEQRVAVGEVGAHAAGAGGGLVAAVGGDGLQLAGPAQLGGQLAPHPLVDLDPAHRRLGGGRPQVGGAERRGQLGRRIAGGAHEQPSEVLGEKRPVRRACREDGESSVEARQLARVAGVRGGAHWCRDEATNAGRNAPQLAPRRLRSPRIRRLRRFRCEHSRAIRVRRAQFPFRVPPRPPLVAAPAAPLLTRSSRVRNNRFTRLP